MSEYNRLTASAKRTANVARVRESEVVCPRCGTYAMPADLMAHLEERCPRALPEPQTAARWLKREHALRCAPSSSLERWAELDLLRVRPDGSVLERDLVQCVAWAQALGVL